MTGNFLFYVQNDAGRRYEPYGSFSIEVGGSVHRIWHSPRGSMSVPEREAYSRPFRFQVVTPNNFARTGYLILHGKVKEADTFGDDIVGNYESKMIDVKNVYEKFSRLTFRNKNDYAQVTLRVDPINYTSLRLAIEHTC